MRRRTADAAAGKWRGILAALGIPEGHLNGRHHSCPRNGEGKDRFRFTEREKFFCSCARGGDGFELLKCCNGWSFEQAAKEVDAIVGNIEVGPPRPVTDTRPALEKAWRETRKTGEAVHAYLSGRGLSTPQALRQATRDYWDHSGPDGSRKLGAFECMVGRMQNAKGEGVSLHITYLTLDGKKAPVEAPRKIMSPVGTINGSAIRLYDWKPGEPLGIAEGIETSIAAGTLHNVSVWSVANRNGIETFEPPEGAEVIHIYGDADESFAGQAGAYRGAERLIKEGFKVKVFLPDLIGDWNDVLLNLQEWRRGAA